MSNHYERLRDKVLSELRECGHMELYEDLASLIKDYESADSYSRIDLAEKIKMRCHPKWFGDISTKKYNWSEWMSLLGKFKNQF